VVTIVYGHPAGPGKGRPDLVIDRNSPGVPGASHRHDGFGAGVSLGDVDGDGYADLAVGSVPVTVLYGSAKGITTARIQSFQPGTTPGLSWPADSFGLSVTLTDINHDGKADLTAVGRRTLWNLRGTAHGLTTTGSLRLSGADIGLRLGKDRFGGDLAG
jgi:FG-GAP repeat protein